MFSGFSLPKQNWSKLPHELIDLLPTIDSLAELKCVLYVLRHTWGYAEYGIPKRITTDEFANGRKRRDGSRIDKGTGLQPQAIRSGLNSAVEHGFLLVSEDDSDKARIRKFYCLNILEVIEDNQIGENHPSGGENHPSGLRQSPIDQRKKPDKEIPLGIENRIFLGLPITGEWEYSETEIKRALEKAFPFKVSWSKQRPKTGGFIPQDFLDMAREEKITPDEIMQAAHIWKTDPRFSWQVGSLDKVWEKWPALRETMGDLDTQRARKAVVK